MLLKFIQLMSHFYRRKGSIQKNPLIFFIAASIAISSCETNTPLSATVAITPRSTAFVITPAPSTTPTAGAFNIVQYASSDRILNNPYRGFYHYTETYSNTYVPLTLLQLQSYREQDNITLILRMFYMEDFVESPISDEYLANIRHDLDIVRQSGFGIIIRFAYTTRDKPPYGDASKTIILSHITQLTPVFQDYGDIIKVVQAGFIGAWGEWYYTDHFVQDPVSPSLISQKDYQDRLDVVSALLHALPKDSFIQVRTPNYKLQLFPNEKLTSINAYSDSNFARVGFHDDCFLASSDDYGTYQSEDDRQYMSNETLFSPMGGETCNPNPPRSSCATALDELALFHWSFINVDYHPDVISNWVSENCFDQIQRSLGYRFVLQRAGFSGQVLQGGNFRLELELKNVGWASLFSKTNVEFVIRNKENKQEYSFSVSDDPRAWLPSNNIYTIAHSLCIPNDAQVGSYDLFLRLSISDSQNKALYSIQLANNLAWEGQEGLNNLGYSFEIQKETFQSNCKSE